MTGSNPVTGSNPAASPNLISQECPKQMLYGPCGSVTSTGGCELSEVVACPFVLQSTVTWAERTKGLNDEMTPAGRLFLKTAQTRPVVITDFPAPAMDTATLRRLAPLLRDSVDAALMGDHPNARVQFPPSYRAVLAREMGLPVWSGLNCRDRNRVALEGELAALADANVVGVHCITGDHTQSGHRPDAKPVFDLDGTRLAALARQMGILNSVAENPSAPPVEQRPARLVQKIRAGGRVCLLNHTKDVQETEAFIETVRSEGITVPFMVSVALITSLEVAKNILEMYPNVLPAAQKAKILSSPDPRAAGAEVALAKAHELLQLPQVMGVVLAGVAPTGEVQAFTEDLAAVSKEIQSWTWAELKV